ncbi:MAG: hypothetical protein QW397_06690 [Fervidicoccaceae archaeon]
MLGLYPFMLSLADPGSGPSTSNLISYIIVFIIIGALFAVIRLACPPCREAQRAEAPPAQPPQVPIAPAAPAEPKALISPELLAAAVVAVHSYLEEGKNRSSLSIHEKHDLEDLGCCERMGHEREDESPFQGGSSFQRENSFLAVR